MKTSVTHKISKKSLQVIIRWLSNKYERAAFPDSFNDRINKTKAGKKIVDILKKNGKEILGLYVGLNSYEELPPEQPYKILLYMIISDNAKNSNTDFQKTLQLIVEKIEKTKAIEVDPSYALLTLDEFSAKDLLTMQRWDFDYLSNREKPGGDTIRRN